MGLIRLFLFSCTCSNRTNIIKMNKHFTFLIDFFHLHLIGERKNMIAISCFNFIIFCDLSSSLLSIWSLCRVSWCDIKTVIMSKMNRQKTRSKSINLCARIGLIKTLLAQKTFDWWFGEIQNSKIQIVKEKELINYKSSMNLIVKTNRMLTDVFIL